jgi:hypothetical protein
MPNSEKVSNTICLNDLYRLPKYDLSEKTISNIIFIITKVFYLLKLGFGVQIKIRRSKY